MIKGLRGRGRGGGRDIKCEWVGGDEHGDRGRG